MLSNDLREKIKRKYRQLKSYRAVARHFDVSDITVKRIVEDLYVKDKRKTGPAKKITRRQETKIKKEVCRIIQTEAQVTARKVQRECSLDNVSTRTVQRQLRSMAYEFNEAMQEIVHTAKHKERRLELAELWLGSSMDWSRVVFTDEKRFNADGPDSWRSWMPKGQRIIRNRRQQGGPSIQIWGMLTSAPLLTVFELPPRGNSDEFMQFIENEVLPVLRSTADDNFIWQQDLAPTHNSTYSQRKFDELAVERLPWPSRSPDLNIIENCWSLLSQRVYDGPQFTCKDDIWRAIDAAVTDLNVNHQAVLKKLYDSIPHRLLEVVKNKGGLVK